MTSFIQFGPPNTFGPFCIAPGEKKKSLQHSKKSTLCGMVSCYFLHYAGNRFWLAPKDMVIVSFMSPAQNCMRSICTQKNETPLPVPPVHHRHIHCLAQYKFILSPIYMHDRNTTGRMNRLNTVILATERILLCWTERGQAQSCLHPSTYNWLTLTPTVKPSLSFLWGCRSRSFRICQHLTGWTSSMPMAPFKDFLHTWGASGPATCSQCDLVRNKSSLKG